jgi:acyl dehydratase
VDNPAQPPSLDVARLGQWLEGPATVVDKDRSIAFAAAINDSNPVHLAGDRVPPMFAVIPAYAVLYRAVNLVTPEEYRERAVHGGQDIRFSRPLRIGSSIAARARPVGIRAVSTGTVVTVEIVVTDEDGKVVSEQFATAFVRGLIADGDAGSSPGRPVLSPSAEPSVSARAMSARAVSARTTVAAGQTFRYAEASGDMMPLHLDDELARRMGFRGIIAHGLCVIGMGSSAAVDLLCDGDSRRLRRLAVRLGAPVYPGDELTTSFYPGGRTADTDLFAFETRTADGRQAVRDGLAEVARAA